MSKKIICLALTMVLVLSLVACGTTKKTEASASPSTVVTGSATADTLTIAITKDENSLTPFTYVSATGLVANRLIYDTLFTADQNNDIVPWMVADDYSVSADYRSYTFTLLDGQKFHDGTPVTTADIEFSFTYPGSQNMSSQRKVCKEVESFDIVEDKTMTINLVKSDINFLRSGLAAMRIISKNQYESVTDATTSNDAIGSGMYKLTEYKAGDYYILSAVDGYFKGNAQVKTINMPIMEDSTAVQTALLSGELAAATSSVSVEMLDTFKSSKDLKVFANAGYSPMIMNINNGIAPFNSTEFRTALTYAIDVNGIMKTLYGEYATVGTKGVIRSDMPYATSGLEYVYDMDKANSILDKAGFNQKNSDGIRLTPDGEECAFDILAYTGNTDRIRTAELMAEQLKKVGIELTVKAMEMDTVDAYVWPEFEVSKGRDYDLSMWGWGTSINPDFMVNMFSSDTAVGTYNVCGYTSETFDALVTGKYTAATNEEELYSVLKEMQNAVANDPGLICFGYADSLQVCNTAQYSGWQAGKGLNVINVYTFLAK